MSNAFFLSHLSELRPEPGSRVNLIPATTQGADVPVFGAPAKGPNSAATQDSISAVSQTAVSVTAIRF